MTDVSDDTLGDPTQNPEGALLPLLSAVLLIGIGLVSIIDAVTVGDEGDRIEAVPDEVGESAVVLIAPGREEQLGVLSRGRTALLAAPWAALPAVDSDFWVVLGDGVDLPRLPDGYQVLAEREEGAWTWVHVGGGEPSPRAERWDLLEALRSAEVAYVDADGTTHPCDQWRFGRWTCGLDEWLWIGIAEPTFRGQVRRCVWAHPRENSTLVIRATGVPVGERLRGRYGIADSGTEMEDGAPVDFAVRVGRAERDLVAQNRSGMSSYRVRINNDDVDGERTDVEFRISSPFVGRRHFCFTASMQGAGPDSDAEEIDLDELLEPGQLGAEEIDATEGTGGAEGSGDGTGGVVPEDGSGVGTGAAARPGLPSRRLDLPARRLGAGDLRPNVPLRRNGP